MLWENLREEEFEGAIEASGGVCVVPIGCLYVTEGYVSLRSLSNIGSRE